MNKREAAELLFQAADLLRRVAGGAEGSIGRDLCGQLGGQHQELKALAKRLDRAHWLEHAEDGVGITDDPDTDYVHESAQERYDNEQREGNAI